MKTAYIICCNDSTEAVVIDDAEAAEVELKRMKKEHEEKLMPMEYPDTYFWHLHEVPVIETKPKPGMPYLKDDHKWYIDLSMTGETSMGICGPYNMYQAAVERWNEYSEWCYAMDVN